jgi:hypothetical protein
MVVVSFPIRGEEVEMAKGQMRPNREKKKPKKSQIEKNAAKGSSAPSAFLQPPTSRQKSFKNEK